MDDKIMIHRSDQEFEVNLLKLKLENSGIPAWILNKHDSSYNTFGDVELFVDRKNEDKAKEIISSKK